MRQRTFSANFWSQVSNLTSHSQYSFIVALRSRSPFPSSLNVYCVWMLASFGVLKTPLQKIFTLGHSVTLTWSNDGNLMVRFPKWKAVRLGNSRNSKYVKLLKAISSLTSLQFPHLQLFLSFFRIPEFQSLGVAREFWLLRELIN